MSRVVRFVEQVPQRQKVGGEQAGLAAAPAAFDARQAEIGVPALSGNS